MQTATIDPTAVYRKLSPKNRLQAMRAGGSTAVTPHVQKARSGLRPFTEHTFPEYRTNWHHAIACRYLDKFVTGEIKRLMIFMPPRHGKSELVSRRLPARIFGENPDAKIIAASYGADLARRMNRDVQRIMDHPFYHEVYPNTRLYGKNIRTMADGSYLRNSDIFEIVGHTGYYRGAGVGGAIGGMGMNYGIIDDPYKNRQDANSDTVRNTIWDWYVGTFRDRLAPGGGILLTTTLWSENGLAYELLRQAQSSPDADQWVVLRFPARYGDPHPDEVRPYVEDVDERTIEGEPLWPEQFDDIALTKTESSIGAYEWAAKFQQNPKPRTGGMFSRDMFEIVTAVPDYQVQYVRYWDKAGTQDAGDYTAGILMARSNNTYYIIDFLQGQWEAGERENVIRQTAFTDKETYGHVITGHEQEPGSGGKDSALNTTRVTLAGFSSFADKVTGAKEVRAEPLASQASANNVKLLQAPWNRQLIDMFCRFPSKPRDGVDAASGAFNRLAIVAPSYGSVQGLGKVEDYESKWG